MHAFAECVCAFLNVNSNIKQFKYLFFAAFFNGREPRRERINPDAFSCSSIQFACVRIAINTHRFLFLLLSCRRFSLRLLILSPGFFFFIFACDESSHEIIPFVAFCLMRVFFICATKYESTDTWTMWMEKRFIINSMCVGTVGLVGEAGAIFNYPFACIDIVFVLSMFALLMNAKYVSTFTHFLRLHRSSIHRFALLLIRM